MSATPPPRTRCELPSEKYVDQDDSFYLCRMTQSAPNETRSVCRATWTLLAPAMETYTLTVDAATCSVVRAHVVDYASKRVEWQSELAARAAPHELPVPGGDARRFFVLALTADLASAPPAGDGAGVCALRLIPASLTRARVGAWLSFLLLGAACAGVLIYACVREYQLRVGGGRRPGANALASDDTLDVVSLTLRARLQAMRPWCVSAIITGLSGVIMWCIGVRPDGGLILVAIVMFALVALSCSALAAALLRRSSTRVLQYRYLHTALGTAIVYGIGGFVVFCIYVADVVAIGSYQRHCPSSSTFEVYAGANQKLCYNIIYPIWLGVPGSLLLMTSAVIQLLCYRVLRQYLGTGDRFRDILTASSMNANDK